MNSRERTPIIVIGSVNADMVANAPTLPSAGETVMGTDFFVSAGGKGGNQAVAAARLGANVTMVGNLGADALGDQAIERLKKENIDCQQVARDSEQSSGVALINVDQSGENQIVVVPGANATLSTEHVENAFSNITKGSIILLQLEIPLASVARAIELGFENDCRVILDPAPAQVLSPSLLGNVFLLTPNEAEAEILSGIRVTGENSAKEAASALLELGVDNLAITLGSGGVLLASKNEHRLIPTIEVEAIDTTGAGDCFNGSLASELAKGNELSQSVEFACRVASMSVTRAGAQDAMPFAHEVKI
ncbi:ribokinase [Gammaproteobacteria bacterium]|nr:ribokinase [Gammaproteobacteria bacterium]